MQLLKCLLNQPFVSIILDHKHHSMFIFHLLHSLLSSHWLQYHLGFHSVNVHIHSTIYFPGIFRVPCQLQSLRSEEPHLSVSLILPNILALFSQLCKLLCLFQLFLLVLFFTHYILNIFIKISLTISIYTYHLHYQISKSTSMKS